VRFVLRRIFLLFVCGLSAIATATPFESTYKKPVTPPTLIRDVTILTGTEQPRIDRGYVYFKEGMIVAMGSGDVIEELIPLEGVRIIEGEGRWLTPGIIDVHSHLGNYSSPSYRSHSDGNESTAPVTAQVWAEHSVWPQDPQFPLALAGGVTTLQILPGSANLIGGRGVTLKNVPGRSVMDMKFPGAPHGLKMACGENPKRVYGGRNNAPSTRMGNVAGYRQAWADAVEYQAKWQEYENSVKEAAEDPEKEANSKPKRDLKLETLVAVLDGEILIHNHCYRADEMAVMIEIGKEYGYEISAFHHGVEAYKVADMLAENGICAAIWADWWRFKMESFDGIKENIALVEKAGACAVVHSDSPWGIQRLNQEAAKAMAAGNRMGMDLEDSDAIRWLTSNPAKALGIADKTGAIEPGKMADLVLWDGSPFSVYTRAEKVLIDGEIYYDREQDIVPVTDFELGHRRAEP
jgi:imidazolonepropionase-like amidohydrolase